MEDSKLNQAYEVGRFTEAISGLGGRFDRLETSMNDRFDKFDERLRQMSELHPTRREFDALRKDVDDVAKIARDAKDGSSGFKHWDKILTAIIIAVVIAFFGISK